MRVKEEEWGIGPIMSRMNNWGRGELFVGANNMVTHLLMHKDEMLEYVCERGGTMYN